VFGLTLDSTVTGDSPVAVPVGNTLATANRKPAPPGPPPAPPAPGPPEFAPVPDSYLASFPEKTREVKPDYPSEARRLGLDGQVTLRVGIDRHGVVRSVRLLKKAGYGMDEAAVQAMWKFKFTPARSKDGQAVDCQINYTHTFQAER
jgi:protein TonB